MRTLLNGLGCIGLVVLANGAVLAADTRVIEATDDITWKSGDQELDGGPLVVEVQKGDILEIHIPNGNHGFITLNKTGDTPAPERASVCEHPDTGDTSGAVIKEIQCDDTQKATFGKLGAGVLHFSVSQNFSDDLPFWCPKHRGGMRGVVKLKP